MYKGYLNNSSFLRKLSVGTLFGVRDITSRASAYFLHVDIRAFDFQIAHVNYAPRIRTMWPADYPKNSHAAWKRNMVTLFTKF